ncbi:MAG: hypothetical protein JXQ27_02255 [Acidobacteria bacterium]|nr:hypothetical protein [Acidobacteriota bacterium]
MSGVDVVNKFDKKFRKILGRDFATDDGSLTEQIQQLKSRLPVNLVKQLLKIDAICRKVMQNPEQTHSQDLTAFVSMCLEAEQELDNFRHEEVRRQAEQQKIEEEARRREEELRAEEKRQRKMEEARRRMEEARETRRREQLRQDRERYQERLRTSRLQREQLAESLTQTAARRHDARRKRWPAAPAAEAARQRQSTLVENLLVQDAKIFYYRLMTGDPLAICSFFCQCWQCGHRFEIAGRLNRRLECPVCHSPCPALEEDWSFGT